jgi:hypothetical protein
MKIKREEVRRKLKQSRLREKIVHEGHNNANQIVWHQGRKKLIQDTTLQKQKRITWGQIYLRNKTFTAKLKVALILVSIVNLQAIQTIGISPSKSL